MLGGMGTAGGDGLQEPAALEVKGLPMKGGVERRIVVHIGALSTGNVGNHIATEGKPKIFPTYKAVPVLPVLPSDRVSVWPVRSRVFQAKLFVYPVRLWPISAPASAKLWAEEDPVRKAKVAAVVFQAAFWVLLLMKLPLI